MLKQRIITAAVLLVIFVGVFFFASERVFQLAMAIVAAAAAYEWASLSALKEKQVQWVSVVVGFIALLVNGVLSNLTFVGCLAWLGLAFWCYAFYTLRAAPVKRSIHRQDWGGVVLGSALIISSVACLQALRFDAPNASAWLLLYCLALVWAMDTGAYFAGKRFGRTKLAPSISPGKTREGVVGGLAAACSLFLLSVLFGSWPSGAVFAVFVATVVSAPFSVVGDLYESRLKRAAGAKDSSDLLPGHGGVLDRIDGVLAAVPMFTALYLWLA